MLREAGLTRLLAIIMFIWDPIRRLFWVSFGFFKFFLNNHTGVNDVFLIFESPPQESDIDLSVSVVVINMQTGVRKMSSCIASDCKIHYRAGIILFKLHFKIFFF